MGDVDVVAQHTQFVALLVQFQHTRLLGGQCLLELFFPLAADLVGGVDRAGDLARLGGQLAAQRLQFRLGAQGLRVVLAEDDIAFLQLGLQPGDVGLEAVDQRALHDLGHGIGLGVLALALAVGGLGLDLRQLARSFIELGRFIVQPFVGRDQAVRLLIARECGQCLVQPLARSLALLVEETRILACRCQLQVEVDVQVGLRKRVRHGGGKVRVGAGVADVDDIALTRGFHFQVLLQQGRQPQQQLSLALGLVLPLLANRRAFFHAQQLDHPLRDPVAGDDVDLRRHVAGRDHAGQHLAGDRVGRAHVQHHGRIGRVLFRDDHADADGDEHRHQQREQRDEPARAQDEQELLQCHGGVVLVVLRTGAR